MPVRWRAIISAGGQMLATLLLKAGHRRFAIVKGNATTSTSLERERGVF